MSISILLRVPPHLRRPSPQWLAFSASPEIALPVPLGVNHLTKSGFFLGDLLAELFFSLGGPCFMEDFSGFHGFFVRISWGFGGFWDERLGGFVG